MVPSKNLIHVIKSVMKQMHEDVVICHLLPLPAKHLEHMR